MPNSYFQFKQFTIQQDKCSMKVCTDACLFGAITASSFVEDKGGLQILDIGTGTGLLSLMCAQKNDTAIIDAVEIDEAAAQQAAENFATSSWAARLTVHQTSIQQFTSFFDQPNNKSTNQLFDLIISNPPFFENDLKSDDAKRNLALHSSELSLEELLYSIERLLRDDGVFGVLLPCHRSAFFESLATASQFHLIKKISVKQSPKHPYFRSILFFSKGRYSIKETELVIKSNPNEYTPEFTELLKDYYLYL